MRNIQPVLAAAGLLLAFQCACGAGTSASRQTEEITTNTPMPSAAVSVPTPFSSPAATTAAVPTPASVNVPKSVSLPEPSPATTDAPKREQPHEPDPAATAVPVSVVMPEPTSVPTLETTAVPATMNEAEPLPPQETAQALTDDLKSAAMACAGQTTSVLFSAVGPPASSDYAPSCLGSGEDGNLYYNGFTVYTYRENGVEVVNYVE